jgi:branched-chain amino acid transport system ATP-binding protein
VRAEIWRCLERLKAEGMAVLIIDKNIEALLDLADRHVVIERGRVAWSGDSDRLRAEREQVERHLHL